MKPRLIPLEIPQTDRYWMVQLDELGEHHFRFPNYTRAALVLDYARALEGRESTQLQRTLDLAGVAVGFFWWHRAHELETEQPHAGASHERLSWYGESVMDELQEQGYSIGSIIQLHAGIMPRLSEYGADLFLMQTGQRLEDYLQEKAAEDADSSGLELQPAEPENGAEWTVEDGADPGPFAAGVAL